MTMHSAANRTTRYYRFAFLNGPRSGCLCCPRNAMRRHL